MFSARHIRTRSETVSLDVWLIWRLQISVTRLPTFASVTVRYNRGR